MRTELLILLVLLILLAIFVGLGLKESSEPVVYTTRTMEVDGMACVVIEHHSLIKGISCDWPQTTPEPTEKITTTQIYSNPVHTIRERK